MGHPDSTWLMGKLISGNHLMWVSFASAILVWLPAGAWMYKGERGVVVAPTAPTTVYLTPKLGAVYVAPRSLSEN